MKKNDVKNLKKRYLAWLYKTTKESLDKIERKFTQAEIDRFLLKELKRQDRHRRLTASIAEFEAYIANKEIEGRSLKYENNALRPEYQLVTFKLAAIEKAIRKQFGASALREIKAAYEQEMTRRILEERQEKR